MRNKPSLSAKYTSIPNFVLCWLTFLYMIFDLFSGWDEGVMGMQVGEVARLRVSFYP